MNISIDLRERLVENTTTEIGGIAYINQDLGLYIPYVTLFGLGIITGILGNTLIIGTILYVKELRQNSTFMMMLNLSVSDVLVSVVVDSSTITGVLGGKSHFDRNPFWCHFGAGICVVACGTSLMSMGFLAINRYMCIFYPVFYKKMFTVNKTKIYCALTWLIGFLYNLPNLIPGLAHYVFESKELDCLIDRTNKAYMITLSATGIITPMCIMGFCYMRIFCHTYEIKNKFAEKHSKSRSESMRLAKSLFASFALFFLCWMPLGIMFIVDTDDVLPKAAHMFTYLPAHLNSALNPIFYAIFNPKIKQSYKMFVNWATFGQLFAPYYGEATHSIKAEQKSMPLKSRYELDIMSKKFEDFSFKN